MADPIIVLEGSSILELPEGNHNVLGDEWVEVVQNGVNVKLPLSVIRSNAGDILLTNFLFKTNTSASDPGTGFIKFNQSAIVNVSAIFISQTTQSPVEDISDSLSEMREGDSIRIQLTADPNNFVSYRLLSKPVDNGSWWTVPVEYVDNLGPVFIENAPVSTVFIFNAGGGINVPPTMTFPTEAAMLANTTLPIGYLAYVEEDELTYIYNGPDPSNINNYVLAGGAPLEAANGLNVTAENVIKLGGEVTEYTEIQSVHFDPAFDNLIGKIIIDSGYVTLQGFDSDTNDGVSINAGEGKIVITDDRDVPTGLEYTQDFASTFVDRSLVDKAFVLDKIAESASNMAIDLTYATIPAMTADQANQDTGAWYLVQNATADPTVTAGWAIYQKLAASTGSLSNYFKIAEQESLDLVVNNASEIDKGIVEEAATAEMPDASTGSGGTATGATGAKLFIQPVKLGAYIASFLAAVHTWTLKQTFLAAPRHSHASANQFLRLDTNKDMVSVPSPTVAEMIAGSDDTKPVTSLALFGYRSLAEIAATVTAGTLNLNFGTQVEAVFNVATAISSNCTITVTSTNGKMFLLQFAVTGTVAFTCPSTFVFESGEVALGRWVVATKILTLIGTTNTEFEIVGFKRGSVWKCISSKYA